MNKNFKKILSIVMILTMVFAMSATAFAVSGEGYYLLSEEGSQAYTSPIHVKAVIDSKQVDGYSTGTATSEVYDVVLNPGSSAKTFTVRDVIIALNAQYPSIMFYNADYELISGEDDYFLYMSVGENVYMPSLPFAGYELDGWYFRVNDKLPIESLTGAPVTNGIKGATIASTTVKAGDIIHFYWNYPYNETQSTLYSATYLSADAAYTDGQLSIQLKKSQDYFDNSFNWNITSFTNYSAAGSGNYNVKVYDAETNSATPVAEGTISASGSGSISCTLQADHNYYIRVDSQSYKLVYGDDDVYIVDNTKAYSKFKTLANTSTEQ